MLGDGQLVPEAVRQTSEAVFARRLAALGHVECGEEHGATVFLDTVIRTVDKNLNIEWQFKRWSRPAS